MTDTKIAEAVAEYRQQEKQAAEKLAAERADAFELGIYEFMKQAQITDPTEQKIFLQSCADAARNQ